MDTRESLRQEVDNAANSLVSKVNRLEYKAEEVKTQLQESVSLQHHVEQNPVRTIGFALAAGFIIGHLVGD